MQMLQVYDPDTAGFLKFCVLGTLTATQLPPLSPKWISTSRLFFFISQCLGHIESRSKRLSHSQGPPAILTLLDQQPWFWVQLDNHIHKTPKGHHLTSLLSFAEHKAENTAYCLAIGQHQVYPSIQVLAAVPGCSLAPQMMTHLQGSTITQMGAGTILV